MTLIVAKNKNNGIGYNNRLLFRIPEDMRFFRETTTGKTVVVGHSTLKSFKDGKPLPNRRNIVLSRDKDLKIQGAEVCRSVKELFEALKNKDMEPRINDWNNGLADTKNDGIEPPICGQNPTEEESVFVIGGGSVYDLLKDYCRYALVTETDDESPADAFISFIEPPRWTLVSRSEKKKFDGIEYTFCKYENNCVKTIDIEY
jgi:dihydrofolate reductase